MRAPASVYVHIPFCTQRCGYCNFALIAGRQDLVDRYLDALEREVAAGTRQDSERLKIETLYFGGGTPTFLQPRAAERLVRILRARFNWTADQPDFEWTVEANPNDLNSSSVQHWTDLGVTRFSLGAQSFQRDKLRFLERTHTGADIRQACERVHEVTAALSLDLIFAVDNERPSQWAADLKAALGCQPQHLSTYQLTFEKGTTFWNRLQHGQLSEAEQEQALALYQQARDLLSQAKYEHYEVSNFARPGFRSRHNQVYWTGKPYLAFGPGAASYLAGIRRVNHSSTTTYIKRLLNNESPVSEVEPYDPPTRAREYFVFGMRRLDGIDKHLFTQETGFDLDELFGETIQRDVRAGYFRWTDNRLQLTEQGLYLSDSLWPDYL